MIASFFISFAISCHNVNCHESKVLKKYHFLGVTANLTFGLAFDTAGVTGWAFQKYLYGA
jgi:hypothetical protein